MSNTEDTLISQLISETYDDGPEKEQPIDLLDLRNYFERKINEVEFLSIADYLDQNNLEMSELLLQDQTQCYRLIYNQSVLDFPSNWSIFAEMETKNLVYVDATIDQDFLLDIFSEITGEYKNLAFVKVEKEVKLIYFPEETSREHIDWFRGFFGKRNKTFDQGAA